MVTIKHLEAYNFKNAMRGMRHPLESYSKNDTEEMISLSLGHSVIIVDNLESSDNGFFIDINTKSDSLSVHSKDIIGPNDLDLAQRLIKAGPEHAKFLRQIFVSMDITAPLYW